MAKQSAPRRVKHVPLRTCVACRQVHAKGTLVRLVRTPQGVFPDPRGKRPGRGAYLHNQPECWQAGLAGLLGSALRTTLTEDDHKRLREFFSLGVKGVESF
ncbi:MAG TPA: YlxR family protein [Anaerolineales bacterium]|nr:YlxR family protein [Anaerolineales bacterium]